MMRVLGMVGVGLSVGIGGVGFDVGKGGTGLEMVGVGFEDGMGGVGREVGLGCVQDGRGGVGLDVGNGERVVLNEGGVGLMDGNEKDGTGRLVGLSVGIGNEKLGRLVVLKDGGVGLIEGIEIEGNGGNPVGLIDGTERPMDRETLTEGSGTGTDSDGSRPVDSGMEGSTGRESDGTAIDVETFTGGMGKGTETEGRSGGRDSPMDAVGAGMVDGLGREGRGTETVGRGTPGMERPTDAEGVGKGTLGRPVPIGIPPENEMPPVGPREIPIEGRGMPDGRAKDEFCAFAAPRRPSIRRKDLTDMLATMLRLAVYRKRTKRRPTRPSRSAADRPLYANLDMLAGGGRTATPSRPCPASTTWHILTCSRPEASEPIAAAGLRVLWCCWVRQKAIAQNMRFSQSTVGGTE